MNGLESRSTELLLNPRLPPVERERLERIATAIPLEEHVWIATSGSSGPLKLVALAKRAILASAAAVNEHLAATAADVWGASLPPFHVGGLGIFARALLTGSSVVELGPWTPTVFAEHSEVTLASLVPAQVRDLVGAASRAPESLRAIIVGGGALDGDLYAEARALGWPLLPSFGMTEACSQVATAALDSLRSTDAPRLRVLPHLDVRLEGDLLAIRGPSVFTGYGVEEGGAIRFVDPKIDGWFVTEDRVEIERDGQAVWLRPLGRSSEFIKIGGESASVARLQAILEEVLRDYPGIDAAVVALPDLRLGAVIHLAVTSDHQAAAIRDAFDARVLPFEKPRRVHIVPIPRSPLGKVRREELLRTLSSR